MQIIALLVTKVAKLEVDMVEAMEEITSPKPQQRHIITSFPVTTKTYR